MDVPVLADQQELFYNSFVWTQDVVWRTCWEWSMIGTNEERKSGKFVLAVQLDDDYDIYLNTYKVSKVGDRSRGWPEGSLLIATTLMCRGGCYSFTWIAPLYPRYVPYIAVLSEEVSSTIFKVFGMTRPGIEPRSPGPLANTLPTKYI